MLDNPEISKLIIYALAGLCAVLALALLIVSVHKNTYYVDEEGREIPPQKKNKKKKERIEVEEDDDDDDMIVVQPPVVEDNPIVLDVEEPVEKVEEPVVEEPIRMSRPAGVSRIDMTVMINGHAMPQAVTSFPCAVGRESTNDLVVSEPAVSRKHAKLLIENGHVVIEDISGHNGVYVNQEKLPSLGQKEIHTGDVIRLGRAEIRIDQIA